MTGPRRPAERTRERLRRPPGAVARRVPRRTPVPTSTRPSRLPGRCRSAAPPDRRRRGRSVRPGPSRRCAYDDRHRRRHGAVSPVARRLRPPGRCRGCRVSRSCGGGPRRTDCTRGSVRTRPDRTSRRPVPVSRRRGSVGPADHGCRRRGGRPPGSRAPDCTRWSCEAARRNSGVSATPLESGGSSLLRSVVGCGLVGRRAVRRCRGVVGHLGCVGGVGGSWAVRMSARASGRTCRSICDCPCGPL